ncbi:MAG: MBL fold metallo-hydrolase [Alphaproteobacteria bacterium]|nr:MBL fold metallo-hydrolase [Alphaproteobacteria bacterium]
MSMILKFCGAAGTVTGSCYWVRHAKGSFLVDCGMFQGSKTLKALNYGDFPFDPKELDFVLLTHAHIDHSGLFPKLLRRGFRGRAFATSGTKDLLAYMLPDSGYIQETEVAFLNRRNAQKGIAPVEPIYTRSDGEEAAARIDAIDYETWFEPGAGVTARLWNAGHILGSASIELEVDSNRRSARKMRMLFSGDIGPKHKLFLPDPSAPSGFDYVFSESTYGARRRKNPAPEERRERLGEVLSTALGRGGVVVIPAFSVERTQELLADIAVLLNRRMINQALVFLDSPLAIKATEVFARHSEELEDVGPDDALFQHPSFHFTSSVEESKAINRYENGVIIIAASGMCDAGRIRHHLKVRLPSPKNTVLLTGYQAQGTLGALLESGKKAVRIQGEDVRVNAPIEKVDFYSGHVDGEGLCKWVCARRPIKRATFLVHGEEEGLTMLRERLLGVGFDADRVIIPRLDDEVDLLGEGGIAARAGPKRLSPEAVAAPDWHNDLAQLSLDIRDQLDRAADERSRKIILRRLRRALEEE